ncbi:helix-turn-helix domain-containing protein [Microbacterium sp.]|uniref:helix-turn-helix domain-containing protein n=1 Tax=Microbacterium sp. TaxID=51671 RepID=UPI0037CCBE66
MLSNPKRGEASGPEDAGADEQGATPEHGGAENLERVIGQRLREYRTAASMTAADLAGLTGLSRAMISRIESATTSCSLTTLQKLADGLNIPVTALFRGVDTDREAIYTPSGHGAITVRTGTTHGHEYASLGHLRSSAGPALEPTLVTLNEASMVFPLFQHPGPEFLYMLEGLMIYGHGAYEYRLAPGDSLLIDGEGPHGPLKLLELPIRFLAVSQDYS